MHKNMFRLLPVLVIFFSSHIFSQTLTQTIRGKVTDEASNSPIPFATVVLLNTDPLIGTSTDSVGNFKLTLVPVGRYSLQVSFLGYEPAILKEILVGPSKEVVLNISIRENTTQLEEIVIAPKVSKQSPLNNMASISARMFSVEEAKRYAGGLDDPARLASAFAGVASSVSDNGIAIRGNSPRLLQWKMEGVEIPNPNHFSDLPGLGGGGLTALSAQLLSNSDFLTGAFPSEYSNALSGMFDLFMKNGNNERYEHTFQLGIVGIDAASEGPFKRGKRSSYLFNYRYSTLVLIKSILPKNAEGTTYQNLSFKLNFPTKRAGAFSLWGIGLLDQSGQKAETDSAKWTYRGDRNEEAVKQNMGACGLSHKIFFNRKIYLKTTLATTTSGLHLNGKRLDLELNLLPQSRIENQNSTFVLSSYLNIKQNARHTNRTGITVTGMYYNMLFKDVLIPGNDLQTVVDENGFSALISAYSSSKVNLANNLLMVIGLNGQVFTLNRNFTIEPRYSLSWQFRPNQSIGIAYGLHSRLERLNYYFARSATGELVNKNMDFTKAHHLVLSYDWSITKDLHLKVEPYFQKLYNVPVIPDSSFSFINLKDEWFFNNKVENTGEGRNYGLEVTVEQYLYRGYYFLFTASAFQSTYKGGDGIWHDSRFNKNYLLNLLGGKEWLLGKKKWDLIEVSGRVTLQGPERYSPIDMSASIAAQDVVYNETNAFSKKLKPNFLMHATISYQSNRKRVAHEIALKVINITVSKEFKGHRFNLQNQTVDEEYDAIAIPNLSYKIEF